MYLRGVNRPRRVSLKGTAPINAMDAMRQIPDRIDIFMNSDYGWFDSAVTLLTAGAGVGCFLLHQG